MKPSFHLQEENLRDRDEVFAKLFKELIANVIPSTNELNR